MTMNNKVILLLHNKRNSVRPNTSTKLTWRGPPVWHIIW